VVIAPGDRLSYAERRPGAARSVIEHQPAVTRKRLLRPPFTARSFSLVAPCYLAARTDVRVPVVDWQNVRAAGFLGAAGTRNHIGHYERGGRQRVPRPEVTALKWSRKATQPSEEH